MIQGQCSFLFIIQKVTNTKKIIVLMWHLSRLTIIFIPKDWIKEDYRT